MTKSEGCRGETVDYGGIGERIVPRGTLQLTRDPDNYNQTRDQRDHGCDNCKDAIRSLLSCWVVSVVVPVTVAQADWQDVQLGHESLAQDDGQPLIVGYVLQSIGKVAGYYIVIVTMT